MPTYEYECEHCKYYWTIQQNIHDESIKICPNCKKETVKRLISSSGVFILKGSGWFKKGGY